MKEELFPDVPMEQGLTIPGITINGLFPKKDQYEFAAQNIIDNLGKQYDSLLTYVILKKMEEISSVAKDMIKNKARDLLLLKGGKVTLYGAQISSRTNVPPTYTYPEKTTEFMNDARDTIASLEKQIDVLKDKIKEAHNMCIKDGTANKIEGSEIKGIIVK